MTKDQVMRKLRLIQYALESLPDDTDVIDVNITENSDGYGRSTVLVYDDVADICKWPDELEIEEHTEHGELHRIRRRCVNIESWVHDDELEDDDDENPYDWGSWHDDIDDLWEEW